jgi:hypothetical protein
MNNCSHLLGDPYNSDRQGQRTDQLVGNRPQVPKGKETRAIAAKRAGFGSAETGRRAELALEQAGPELTELMVPGSICFCRSIEQSCAVLQNLRISAQEGLSAVG